MLRDESSGILQVDRVAREGSAVAAGTGGGDCSTPCVVRCVMMMRRVLHRRTQRSKTRLESNERGQKLRMGKREPDVGIAVGALPYPWSPARSSSCAAGGAEEGDDRVSL